MAAPADAILSVGITLSFKVGGGSELFTSKLIDVSGPDMSAAEIDSTDQAATNRWRTFIQGLIDAGTVEFLCEFDSQLAVANLFGAVTVTNPRGVLIITWPLRANQSTADTWTIDAFMTGYRIAAALGDKCTAGMTYKLSGIPVFAAGS